MIRKEILLTLAGCLTFYSCASTNLLLTKKNCENKFELIIRNESDEDLKEKNTKKNFTKV